MVELKNEESGTEAAEENKGPFFLAEGHPLLAAAERIS